MSNLDTEYRELITSQGATIKSIVNVNRREHMHYLLEDADFSLDRISKFISEGETDAAFALTHSYPTTSAAA